MPGLAPFLSTVRFYPPSGEGKFGPWTEEEWEEDRDGFDASLDLGPAGAPGE